MKHLKIVYGEAVLWDGPVGSLEWSDSENGVKVEGRVRAKPASGGGGSGLGGGLLDMLSKASKAKTSQVADEKREAYEAEIVEPESTVEESVGK